LASSGTYTFDPSIADLVLEAYGRCGIRSGELTHEHMVSARMSTNLELLTWSNRQVNLWKVDLHTAIPLVAGDVQYDLDSNVISVLDVYIRTSNAGVNTDRIMTPISRTEYANLPEKARQGFPSQYWFDRQNTPKINLYLAPNDDPDYTLYLYVLRRIQDAAPIMGQTLDVNYRFIDAFAAGLAARLAVKWAADRVEKLEKQAALAFGEAANEDREIVDTYINPDLSGYYR
jgi:hypothetical protein